MSLRPAPASGTGNAGLVAVVAEKPSVQTPTLALLVARELEIRGFVPEDYLEVVATFAPASLGPDPIYLGTWFRGETLRPEAKRIKTPAGGPDGADFVAAMAIIRRARTGRAAIESVRAEEPPQDGAYRDRCPAFSSSLYFDDEAQLKFPFSCRPRLRRMASKSAAGTPRLERPAAMLYLACGAGSLACVETT